MSSASATHALPAPIIERLRGLRARIVQFVLVDGLARLLLTIIGLVLLDLVVDRLFRMDGAQRTIMLCVLVGIVVFVLWRWLVRPLTRRVGDDALILQVEQRNRQLGESLISTVQFSRQRHELAGQGYSDALVDATIRQGTDLATGIDFGGTINGAAMTRNVILMLAGIAGIAAIGYGVASGGFWRTWFNRNILLSDDLWPRNTRLAILGVEEGRLVIPRGEDHRQIVEVLPDSPVSDVEVSIEFDDGNSRTTQKMRQTGMLDGREHMLVFRNVANPFRFRASGGDDMTEWVDVELVEPPAWSELRLAATPPAYTGARGEVLSPGGGPYSLLEGSSLEIHATANKPLAEAVLSTHDRQWPMQRGEEGEYLLSIPSDELSGSKYTFELADTSGLRSSRPAAFTITIKPDRPPMVRATLLGISGLVVPRARVPISWTATDEYALTKAEMVYDWSGDSSDSVPNAGTVDLSPPGGTSETAVQVGAGASEIKSVDVLDMEPLGVPTGVSLNVAIAVADSNTLTGPGVGLSRKFLLRVVTEDELRADLLRREIEQRQAFELILKNQEELQVDLRALAATVNETGATLDDAKIAGDMLGWQRRQKLVGTNMATVADRFEEFLVEVQNNRLDETETEIDASQSIEVRFNERIIEPIRALDQEGITQAVQLLDQSRRSIGDHAALAVSVRQTADRQDAIIEAMRTILAAMEDSETYQELVNLAIEVRERQKQIRELTREKQNNADTRDIFDDPSGGEKPRQDSDDGNPDDGTADGGESPFDDGVPNPDNQN